jgi:hypothetical protein
MLPLPSSIIEMTSSFGLKGNERDKEGEVLAEKRLAYQ